jgi:hypothetical protein
MLSLKITDDSHNYKIVYLNGAYANLQYLASCSIKDVVPELNF